MPSPTGPKSAADRCGARSTSATWPPNVPKRSRGPGQGCTKAIGLDVATLYGQLLRRMPIIKDPAARFAVVVPSKGRGTPAGAPSTRGGFFEHTGVAFNSGT